jgi:DNA end-binding protein Ku
MAARSIATASISFGLVTVPVRIYPATRASAGLSFHLLHEKDHARLKQQYVCEKDGQVVPRSEMVKGYEFAKGRYVIFTNEELKALDEKATNGIEIAEFVPEGAVDPVYFERSYYLGPDKNGAKAFSLLGRAMQETALLAVAKYAARGKDYLVLLRPSGERLEMIQLYNEDEVRPSSEVPVETRSATAGEVKLATRLIESIASKEFDPGKYGDEVRRRIQKLIQAKVQGKDITAPVPQKRKAEVVDLMEALQASLARKGQPARTLRAARAARAVREDAAPLRRVAGRKK